MVLRIDSIYGPKPISGQLRQMISIIEVDISPDLRQARVKVSIIGDRKDKITAIRWLQGNTGGIRYALAKRVKGMKRVPNLSFQHVDVGQAVDVMITIDKLAAEQRERQVEGGLDFGLDDDDAFGLDGHLDETDLFDDDGDADDDLLLEGDGDGDGDLEDIFV